MLGTYALQNWPVSFPLLVAAFAGTLLVYRADRRWWPGPEDKAMYTTTPGRRVGLLAVLALLASLPYLKPATVGWAAVLGALGLLYAFPLGGPDRRLKAWASGWRKPILVAGGWALGAVVLPWVEAGMDWSSATLALLVYRFLFVLPNVVLSDRLDREGDRRAGLHTVAVRTPSWGRTAARLSAGVAGTGALLAGAMGWAPPLLLLDAAGPLLLLVLLLVPEPSYGGWLGWTADLVVAWPLVTFLWAWAT
ncbi:MAG: hypothetical protein D6746_14215 [Bacteroidetes bacterium]|nr:MAG: hypothetical protein D6746_14215 [Bacteroidota bacterium]